MNVRKLFYTICTIIIGIAVLFGAWKLTSSSSEENAYKFILSEKDHIIGDSNAQNVFIEYADFQCPACAAYHPTIKKIREEFKTKVTFAYRHFPLPQHKNAQKAAYASEAAAKQGKFWEMHDLLYEKQSEWSEKSSVDEVFLEYASSLKLERDQFKKDMDVQEVKDKINEDLQTAGEAGVNSTPTFFLNGRKIDISNDYNGVKRVIDEAIKLTTKIIT